MWRKGKPYSLRVQTGIATKEVSTRSQKQLNTELQQDLAIQFLGTHTKDSKFYQWDAFTASFLVNLFTGSGIICDE